MRRLTLIRVDGEFAVCRLPFDAPAPPIPDDRAVFHSVTRTASELSVVCPLAAAPDGATVEPGWRMLAVAGPLDFELVGVLAGLAGPLADVGLSMFVISTYDTDYLLVKDLDGAVAALRAAGHLIA